MRKCTECRQAMKKNTEDTVYPAAGFNFKLKGVPTYICTHCGNEETSIPAIKNLHMVIAWFLIDIPNLKGPQLRFLRRYQRLTQEDLGKLLGNMAPETVSKWENDAQTPSPQAILLIKKLTEEFIAEEWRELEQLNSEISLTVDAANFAQDTSLRDFVIRIINQQEKPQTLEPHIIVYSENKKRYLLDAKKA